MSIRYPEIFKYEPIEYANRMYQSLCDFNNYLFFNIPGINGP